MQVKNKCAVVTGASSGMGKAIVERFVKEGASVVAVARRQERLEDLRDSLKDEPGRVEIFVGDVSKRETNDEMIERCLEVFGGFDILVNNAGIMDDMAGIADATDEKFEQIMDVNVYGPMCAMRKAVQTFKLRGTKGSIVNVASVGALRNVAGAIYCASKAALVSMTKNTSFMYWSDGIRCNAIAPGGITTEIAGSMGMPNMEGYGKVQKMLAMSPAPGSAEEIANAALFLASDQSAYISGDVLVVDGGWIS